MITSSERIRQLVRDILIYGLGGILTKGISFVLLPLYTRIFPPEAYGVLETMTLITTFLSAVLIMGLDAAQSFYFFREKNNGKKKQIEIISAIFQWNLSIGSFICILAILCYPFLNRVFFPDPIEHQIFIIAFVGSLFTLLFSQLLSLLRLLYRAFSYVLLILFHSLLSIGFTLALIFLFKQGIWGILIGNTLATGVVTPIAYYLVHDYIDLSKLYIAIWPRLAKFGMPLVPAGIAYYLMNSIDRWFLLKYHGPNVLGIYSVSLKFGLIIIFAVDIFNRAWWPIALDAMHSEDGPRTFRSIAKIYTGIGVMFIIMLTFLSPYLVKLFVSPSYQSAWLLIGVLAWQAFFYGFSTTTAGIWKAEKTFLSSYLMMGATILNLLLNFLLVPTFAGLGAALATAISYLLWLVAMLLVSEKYWPIQFPFSIFFFQISFGIFTTFLLLIDKSRLYCEKWAITVFSLFILLLLPLFINTSKFFSKKILIKLSK